MQEANPARWQRAVGPNADRYLRIFESISRRGGGSEPAWNWAAFFHSTGWFCYRRMYGWAFLNLFGLPLMITAFVLISSLLAHGDSSGLPLIYLVVLAYFAIVFVLVPIYADSLYYQSLRKQFARAGKASDEVASFSPSSGTMVGALAFGIAWILFVGAVHSVVNAAYADYTARAKVAAGLAIGGAMRNDITEFHEREKRLPTQEEAADLRRENQDSTARYVKSVAYDSGAQRIVITMREPFPEKRVALYADVQEGKLVWTCRTIDIEQKYLPLACRN